VRARFLVAGPIAIVASLLLAASAVASSTVQVTTKNDATPGCTLRDAVGSLNANSAQGDCVLNSASGDDTITFAPALIGQTITLTGGELSVNDTLHDLQILGPGMNQLTIDANLNGRAFFIDATNTLISGLSVVNGSFDGSVIGFAQAGAILNANGGDLTLSDVKVANSTSTASADGGGSPVSAAGGGIYASQGRLFLDHSIVTGNSATATQTGLLAGDSAQARGGGIYANAAFVSIVDSTVSGNQATATSSGLDGADATAGIYTNDEIEMSQSTISGGVATATATGLASTAIASGGIFANTGPISVQQSTIAANKADASALLAADATMAGGVMTSADPVGFQSSTIALNGPTTGTVDGANLLVDGGTTDLENTILSDPRGGGQNCDVPSGSLTTSGFNDDFSPLAGPSCFPVGAGTDLGSNPLLAAAGLANNGGPTKTIALQPTSPMIDKGSNADLTDPNQDQRGLLRPVEFPGLANAAGGNGTDIGAFEVQQACAGFTQSTPSTPCPPPGPAPSPAPSGPTGQRAAAKKKCKKKFKHNKTKRKKCIKRAKKLPA
jgi:hypothetical protein